MNLHNSTTLLGRFMGDPVVEKKVSQGTGKPYTKTRFQVSVRRSTYDKTQDQDSDVFMCEVFNGVAETIGSRFKKGDYIIVQGTMLSYKKGDEKYANNWKLKVENFNFVPGGKKSENTQANNTGDFGSGNFGATNSGNNDFNSGNFGGNSFGNNDPYGGFGSGGGFANPNQGFNNPPASQPDFQINYDFMPNVQSNPNPQMNQAPTMPTNNYNPNAQMPNNNYNSNAQMPNNNFNPNAQMNQNPTMPTNGYNPNPQMPTNNYDPNIIQITDDDTPF